MTFDARETREGFEQALATFTRRLAEDRWVLAAVQVGSFDEAFIWQRETIYLWIIEADGVSKRHRSDGGDERLFRTFVEDEILIHAELIPRSRFKRMVEGSSRTAFTHSHFAKRELVYCDDPSIEGWFQDANTLATRDQQKSQLAVVSWIVHVHRYALKSLNLKGDLALAQQETLCAAHGLAALQVILSGGIYEGPAIDFALAQEKDLFQEVYLDVLARPDCRETLEKALARIEDVIKEGADSYLRPVLKYLKKEARSVPLSEMADHFAHSILYPWHLESTCEWLERQGRILKLSSPYRLTTKSRVEIEEPAYELIDL